MNNFGFKEDGKNCNLIDNTMVFHIFFPSISHWIKKSNQFQIFQSFDKIKRSGQTHTFIFKTSIINVSYLFPSDSDLSILPKIVSTKKNCMNVPERRKMNRHKSA